MGFQRVCQREAAMDVVPGPLWPKGATADKEDSLYQTQKEDFKADTAMETPTLLTPEAHQLPLYRQMKDDLVRRVASGEWRPGELVPSEVSLALEYNVSVGTARKAIDELAQDRLVVRQRGRGTMIASNKQRYEPFRFYRLRLDDETRAPETTTYISCDAVKATTAEAAKFQLKRGAGLVRITRVRSRGGKPLVLENILLRQDLCPNAAELIARLKPESIYSAIERAFHILIVKVDERVRAVAADQADVQFLNAVRSEPMLQVERKAFDVSSVVIECRTMRGISDLHYFSTIS